MKIFSGDRVVFICCFFLSPVLSNAQEGNHCAVKKSPFRVSMETGNIIFTNQCRSCHQPDSLKPFDINLSLNEKGVTGDKTKMIEIVIRGQTSNKDTGGKSNQHMMPAYPEMNDQEIADVLTYIRNSFGNKESPVKVSEVKSARSKLN
jgi:mono/diheme cytochrome c family protein